MEYFENNLRHLLRMTENLNERSEYTLGPSPRTKNWFCFRLYQKQFDASDVRAYERFCETDLQGPKFLEGRGDFLLLGNGAASKGNRMPTFRSHHAATHNLDRNPQATPLQKPEKSFSR